MTVTDTTTPPAWLNPGVVDWNLSGTAHELLDEALTVAPAVIAFAAKVHHFLAQVDSATEGMPDDVREAVETQIGYSRVFQYAGSVGQLLSFYDMGDPRRSYETAARELTERIGAAEGNS